MEKKQNPALAALANMKKPEPVVNVNEDIITAVEQNDSKKESVVASAPELPKEKKVISSPPKKKTGKNTTEKKLETTDDEDKKEKTIENCHIGFVVDEEHLKYIRAASLQHKNNISQYLKDLIDADIDKNKKKYDSIIEITQN